MGNTLIAQRVGKVSSLSGRFDMIPLDQVRMRLNDLRSVLSDPMSNGYSEERFFDARDTDVSTAGAWVRAQGLPNERVKAYWWYDSEAISIELYDFLDNLDELWYPSSDDVTVESESDDFLLDIDHEEQFRLILKDRNKSLSH
jgi:hypothetical protein